MKQETLTNVQLKEPEPKTTAKKKKKPRVRRK